MDFLNRCLGWRNLFLSAGLPFLEFVVMLRLSQARHFQTPALLGLSPSLSYIELLMFWQSAWYHRKQSSHSTPLQDQVTGCSQLPHGKTVEFPSRYTCVWMGPGFDSMSSDKASSRREIYRRVVCTAFPFSLLAGDQNVFTLKSRDS